MSDPVPALSFREALAHFASGVTIVATRTGERLAGLTATAFSSVSLDPPLVLVCVARTASAHPAIAAAEGLGISVLAEEQAWIAKQFARQGVDKFAGVPLVAERSVPLVEGALAQLECRVHARHEAGDHTIVVAEVLQASAAGGKPLLHYARKLGGFDAQPEPRA